MTTTLTGLLAVIISVTLTAAATAAAGLVTGYWCVARSDASDDALQRALDYACAAGADCEPIMSTGLCYLPNTLQAHASYAFNSYFHRRSMAPGSCDFSATATVANTDPSYGSCVYPSSASAAGGGPPTPGIGPNLNGSTLPNSGDGGLNPVLGPTGSSIDNSGASSSVVSLVVSLSLMHVSLLLLLLHHLSSPPPLVYSSTLLVSKHESQHC